MNETPEIQTEEKRRPGRPRKVIETAPETMPENPPEIIREAVEFSARYAPNKILRDGIWKPNDADVTFKFNPGDKGELPTTEAAYVVGRGKARYL